MPVPLITYEFLCSLYGEAATKMFWYPTGIVADMRRRNAA